MGVAKTQSSLLLHAKKDIGAEGGTSVLAARRCPSPGAVIGEQQRAQVVDERGGFATRTRPSWLERHGTVRCRLDGLGHVLRIRPGTVGNEGHRAPIVHGVDPRKRKNPGDDLFSRKAALSVSSALESLTSVFGMGTGVASPLESPGSFASGRVSASDHTQLAQGEPARGRREEIFDFVGCQGSISRDPQPLTPGQLLKRSSPRPLVPLSFIRHRTSTCGLSNRWSPCGLTRLTRWGTSSRGELRT